MTQTQYDTLITSKKTLESVVRTIESAFGSVDSLPACIPILQAIDRINEQLRSMTQ